MMMRRPIAVLLVAAASGGAVAAETDREPTCDAGLTTETVLDRVESHRAFVSEVPNVPRNDAGLGLDSAQMDIGDVELFVQQAGEGAVMVLIPGGPGNSQQSYLPCFLNAARFGRVILYDPRGVGDSEFDAGRGFSAQQAISDLDRLRESLRVDQWIVMGHSFGGLLAQLYAIAHSEHTLGLVLIGSSIPSFMPEEPRWPGFMTEVERARVRAAYSMDGQPVVPLHTDEVGLDAVSLMVFNGYRNGDWKRQFFFKPTEHRMAQIARHEWRHAAGYTRAVAQSGFAVDLEHAFDACPIPVMVVEGKWDLGWDEMKPERLSSMFPRGRLVVIDQAGHNPFADQPGQFFDELERFVGSISPVLPDDLAGWRRHLHGLGVLENLELSESGAGD